MLPPPPVRRPVAAPSVLDGRSDVAWPEPPGAADSSSRGLWNIWTVASEGRRNTLGWKYRLGWVGGVVMGRHMNTVEQTTIWDRYEAW